MSCTAILVGSGGLPLLTAFGDHECTLATPFGTVLSAPRIGSIKDQQVIALARHGASHSVVPHEVNYRANLWLLKELGAHRVIATHTVGAIDATLQPSALVLPEQIIDYTWGRQHSYSKQNDLIHVDFSMPYDRALRQALVGAAAATGVDLINGGIYGCTQGPRLETAAEIDRMQRDGCTLVGMTAMPEAALACELDLPYASLCIVVNPAAGRGRIRESIDLDALNAARVQGVAAADRLLVGLFDR